MKIQIPPHSRVNTAYALLLVLILLAVSLLVMGATMNRTMTTSKLNDRNNLYIATGFAAEAATEKALTRMLVDYQIDSEALVISNMGIYQAAVPKSSENNYWTNFEFSDGLGHVGSNYVARISTNANTTYVQLQAQFAGLYGFASTYRILSNVRPLNSTYRFTNAVQQDIQLAEIPVFQFAIFYNSLLEFTWANTLVVRGIVHSNTNIYVGSGNNLSFSNLVTASGSITWPPWDGHTDTNDYSGNIYFSQGTNGHLTGQPALTLPIGTNNSASAVHAIIDPPPTNEVVTSSMGKLRFYNNADMTIIVSNNLVTTTLKTSPTDGSMITTTNWGFVSNFMSTNITFWDEREAKTVVGTQIDVGKFNSWILTNSSVISKFSSSLPLNIVYVADYRSPSNNVLRAVRLTNGVVLPPNGLTVATPGPLYIEGNYNCTNSAYLATTNTSASVPSSVISDALTILSPNWKDPNSTSSSTNLSSRSATDVTVNTAIITGIVYSTDSTAAGFSGGVVNMPRLLEDWTSSHNLWLNTSMVNLFNSTWATNQWKSPGIYYSAPTRNINFDQNFTQSAKLPPGTPRMHQLQRAVWCNPIPGTTGSTNVWIYNYSY